MKSQSPVVTITQPVVTKTLVEVPKVVVPPVKMYDKIYSENKNIWII